MFGVFFNIVILFFRFEFCYYFVNCGFFYGYNCYVMLFIVVMVFFGLIVVLILKFRDNMFYVMFNQLINVVMIMLLVLFLDFYLMLMFFFIVFVVLLVIFIFNVGVKVELVLLREKIDVQI